MHVQPREAGPPTGPPARRGEEDPRVEGSMRGHVKGSPGVSVPAAVELIASASKDRRDHPSEDTHLGRHVDEYA